jgi:hypothetical protein
MIRQFPAFLLLASFVFADEPLAVKNEGGGLILKDISVHGSSIGGDLDLSGSKHGTNVDIAGSSIGGSITFGNGCKADDVMVFECDGELRRTETKQFSCRNLPKDERP